MTKCGCCGAVLLDGYESCRAMFNAVLEREYSDPAFGEALGPGGTNPGEARGVRTGMGSGGMGGLERAPSLGARAGRAMVPPEIRMKGVPVHVLRRIASHITVRPIFHRSPRIQSGTLPRG